MEAKAKYSTIQRFFADQAYGGALQNKCFLKTGALLSIAKRIVDKGFKVILKRWIVERTFAWLAHFRRMSKDYEHSPQTSRHTILINMITIILGQLVKR